MTVQAAVHDGEDSFILVTSEYLTVLMKTGKQSCPCIFLQAGRARNYTSPTVLLNVHSEQVEMNREVESPLSKKVGKDGSHNWGGFAHIE